jgi:hypothetical protein
MGSGYDRIYYKNSPIGSIDALCKTLGITPTRLNTISSNVENFYTVFEKQVKSKVRLLCDPQSELKQIQRRIISRIFCHLDFPVYLHGGIKTDVGRDFFTNANAHRHAVIAITIDIKNFFPSIRASQVNDVFRLLFKFPPDVANALSSLTTLNDCLPQGAPTSSYISNLIMFQRESKLASRLNHQNLVYTRLIDDMTVSSSKELSKERVAKITSEIIGMLHAYGFQSHPDKYKIYSRSNPVDLMTVTGLWVNRGSPKILPKTREQISFDAIALEKMALLASSTTTDSYHKKYNSVSGRVAFLNRFRHVEARRLRMILNAIPPTYDNTQSAHIRNLVQQFCKRKLNPSKLGYIRKFYKLQRCVSILKLTSRGSARALQSSLNLVRPTRTLKDLED